MSADEPALILSGSNAHEILDILQQRLAEEPERADLWMMRLQILSTLRLKSDFASALQEASAIRILRRDLDWPTVGRMWRALAPGESPPAGVRLRESDLGNAPPRKKAEELDRKERRFSDFAKKVAARELVALTESYSKVRSEPGFSNDFARKMREVLQRPTPMLHARALGRELGGQSQIYLKREDLRHTTPDVEVAAAHAYIATRLGRSLLLTGNDVDEFSIALAQMGKRLDLPVTIVVTPEDVEEKAEHVAMLRELGAKVEVVQRRAADRKDPREGALALWTTMHSTAYLALSLGTGPTPYPRIVSDFQMQLGYESELQIRAMTGPNRRRSLVAAVHSEADSIGFVLPYLRRSDVDVFYADSEWGHRGRWKASARLRAYNGARREHNWLRATGCITHLPVTDEQAQHAQEQVRQLEGIPIGLEDARAVSLAAGLAQADIGDQDIVVLVS